MRKDSNPQGPLVLAALALTVATTGCRSLGGGPEWRAVDTATGATVGIEEMADELADYDVVFLGELHPNTVGHELQLALTKALHERRGNVALSLEMFERDTQARLDLYLAGTISEQYFLVHSRPWSNYAEHYRPGVEYAREHGLDVIAANCVRAIASEVAREGLLAGLGRGWASSNVLALEGPYWDRFVEVMGGSGSHGHGGGNEALKQVFAAQCIKDETMAESIAWYLDANAEDDPLVVHWNGRFHSDYGHGTVARLLRRKPHLAIAIVTMVPSDNRRRPLTADENAMANYVWLVPDTE